MEFRKGDAGTITFGDKSKARVKVVRIQTHPVKQRDIWLSYEEGETNRVESVDEETESFSTPESLLRNIFKKD